MNLKTATNTALTKLCIFVFLVIAIVNISGCKPADPPPDPVPDCKLLSMKNDNNLYHFKYEGELLTEVYDSLYDNYYRLSYKNGLLIEMEILEYSLALDATVIYDSVNTELISELRYSSGQEPDHSWVYNYDQEFRPTKIQKFDSTGFVVQTISLKWQGQNLARFTNTGKFGSIEYEYDSYDTDPSPYTSNLLQFIFLTNPYVYSSNNPVEATRNISGNKTEYFLEYEKEENRVVSFEEGIPGQTIKTQFTYQCD
ncbi:hypothetical protein GYB22_12765 [bacterium]|nr:hypothetical protein [bacterium]